MFIKIEKRKGMLTLTDQIIQVLVCFFRGEDDDSRIKKGPSIEGPNRKLINYVN